MTRPSKPNRDLSFRLLTAYYATIALFLIASLFPHTRFWGVNWWAYWPDWVWYGLILLSGGGGPLVLWLSGRTSGAGHGSALRFYLVSAIGAIVVVVLFVQLHSRTFFLGDGYQLLQRLADHVPPVKSWDMFTSRLHYALFDLIGASTDDQALRTFQLVSWSAGASALVLLIVSARHLFERNRERYLFMLGVSSSGLMLLFFGYVEHYALFVFAVLAFAVAGMLVLEGKISRWWALLPAAMATLLHIFGVILAPALVYVIMRTTPVGRALGRTATSAKWLIAFVVMAVAAAVYYYFYTHYYFFRFAIIPLFADRFAADGETLLAPRRLLDLANLLVMLLPGLPVLVATWVGSPVKGFMREPAFRFLTILFCSAFAALFIFNPKLGLPRDWDLFAFVGVPLSVMGYYLTLRHQPSEKYRTTAVMLSIALALLILGPRVGSQASPRAAVGHLEDYLKLDKVKSKNAWTVLMEYHRMAGNRTIVAELEKQYEQDYPEIGYNRRSGQLINEGKFGEAATWARQAIQINPLLADGYSNLGVCYLDMGYLDSAQTMLKIADGLNPYSAAILNNLGSSYVRKEQFADAVTVLQRVLELDSMILNAHINLTAAYYGLHNEDSSIAHLRKLALAREMGYEFFQRMGDLYLSRNRPDLASQAYHIAIEHGMDSSYVQQKAATNPQVKW